METANFSNVNAAAVYKIIVRKNKTKKLVDYYDDNCTDNWEPYREFLYEEWNKKK